MKRSLDRPTDSKMPTSNSHYPLCSFSLHYSAAMTSVTQSDWSSVTSWGSWDRECKWLKKSQRQASRCRDQELKGNFSGLSPRIHKWFRIRNPRFTPKRFQFNLPIHLSFSSFELRFPCNYYFFSNFCAFYFLSNFLFLSIFSSLVVPLRCPSKWACPTGKCRKPQNTLSQFAESVAAMWITPLQVHNVCTYMQRPQNMLYNNAMPVNANILWCLCPSAASLIFERSDIA